MNFEIVGMKKEHVAEAARLEIVCFSSPWSENALAEELKNENSHFLAAVSHELLGYIGVRKYAAKLILPMLRYSPSSESRASAELF